MFGFCALFQGQGRACQGSRAGPERGHVLMLPSLARSSSPGSAVPCCLLLWLTAMHPKGSPGLTTAPTERLLHQLRPQLGCLAEGGLTPRALNEGHSPVFASCTSPQSRLHLFSQSPSSNSHSFCFALNLRRIRRIRNAVVVFFKLSPTPVPPRDVYAANSLTLPNRTRSPVPRIADPPERKVTRPRILVGICTRAFISPPLHTPPFFSHPSPITLLAPTNHGCGPPS